jgi:hypothetical protein
VPGYAGDHVSVWALDADVVDAGGTQAPEDELALPSTAR